MHPDDALRELYSAAPEDFLDVRGRLAAQLRREGEPDAAADVSRRRKPTVAAWIVNQLVHQDATVIDRVVALGDQLRAAQHALDAPTLRSLTAQRRQLVATLAADALSLAGRPTSSTSLHDDVRGTFDAAVADPEIAARLGTLQRPEQFAGFGFTGDVTRPPQLTLVRGGRDDGSRNDGSREDGAPNTAAAGKTAAKKAAKKTARPTAAQRKHTRLLEAAHSRLTDAGLHRDEADQRARDAREALRHAQQVLAEAKQRVDICKREVEDSRTDFQRAKTVFRTAQQEFIALEKDAPDG